MHIYFIFIPMIISTYGVVMLSILDPFRFFSAFNQEFQMKMESLQQRREELERKEYSLKEHLLKFDHFLKVLNSHPLIIRSICIVTTWLISVTLAVDTCICTILSVHSAKT